MAVDRLFLGWDRPCLHVAVDEFVRRFGRDGVLDLERLIVVLPGARAGRRLIELLVERAERDGWRLIPPMTGTPGTLPECLYEPALPTAGDVARLLAWVAALRGADQEELGHVFPRRPAEDDFESWLTLAGLCERLHAELAGDMLTFADVVLRGNELPDFNERDRWQALETVRRLYVARLQDLGMADRHEARIEAVNERKCRSEKTIVLLATPELNRVVRGMLEQVAGRVSVWTFAPAELAERIDEFGCTRPEAWSEAWIDLDSDRVELVEGPSDQAAAVLRTIAGFQRRYAAAEIAVGVPDEEVVPFIQQQFEQHELIAHDAAGLPLSRTGPFRLLEVAADFAERRRNADFAALVRHPDAEPWLNAPTRIDDWISELDEFTAEHLQASLRVDSFQMLPQNSSLRRVFCHFEKWLAPLTGTRPLGDWAEPILELVLGVYGDRELDRNDAADRIVVQTCDAIYSVLKQCDALDAEARPPVDAATALRLMLRMVQGEAIPLPPRRDSIDLLGWLELPLDDAPALIVTGFNEGLVPDSINADAFLPNQFRRHLGLLDNDRRYARDAYALSAVLASRPDVKLIAGRRSANFEPLTPSRLLFACDDETVARRIQRFFPDTTDRPRPCVGGSTASALLPASLESGEQVAQKPLDHRGRPGGVARSDARVSRFEIPRPVPPAEPITSMRVTSFRDFLACPYRFYLRHVLGLETVSEANELDPLNFGTLAHEVLKRFGHEPIRDSTNADAIGDFLRGELDEFVGTTFGGDALPAVRVQVEQLRRRLDAFARWQAGRRADGWRIEHTELAISHEQSAFVVDGEPMYLRGRIDRIDRHERTGEWNVLDYKTSEKGDGPDSACGRDGTWHDLQLPLYRHLVRAAGIANEMKVGYIVLPRDPDAVEVRTADWTAEDIQRAEETARDVVRRVRRGEFGLPTEPPPRGFDEFARICQEGRTAPRLDDDEEEDAA